MAAGVRRIVGGPFEKHWHKKTNVNALWKELQAHEGKKDIMTACTDGNDHTIKNAEGLTMGHAFTVLGTHTLSNGVRLVKMRNPWGTETFKGAWSDSSALWTDEHAKKVNLKKTLKDGIFHMSIEDYAKKFELTDINYNTKGMHQASFVRLNDDKSKADACVLEEGAKCGRHTLTLKSDVDQTVWLTAHTWDQRTMPTKCQTDLGYHLVFLEGTDEDTIWNKHGFSNGSLEFPAIKMKANESKTIHGEWNWIDANYSKDWSVVAWGDKGSLSLTHKNGLVSDMLPLLKRQGATKL